MAEWSIDDELAIALERTVGTGGPVVDRQTLHLPIRVLNPRPPLTLGPDARLREAIRLMRDHRVGFVLIVEGATLVGILTERDLLMKLDGADLEQPVSNLMTPDPETLHPDDPISYALNHMADGGYRHVPLVDAKHRPVGIVSVKDVVNYLADCFPLTVFTVPPAPERARRWRSRYGA
jgi:CBS domain-containing protein